MKAKLLLIPLTAFAIVTALVLAPIGFEPVEPTSAASEVYPTYTAPNNGGCPAGSYNIGTKDGVNPICKLEPTGCPFGDSVPLDKCTPPPDITCNADWSKCEPKNESEPTNVPTNDSRSTSGKEEQSSGCFSSK